MVARDPVRAIKISFRPEDQELFSQESIGEAGADVVASRRRFLELLREEFSERFPGARIEVVFGTIPRDSTLIDIDADGSPEGLEAIRLEIQRTYEWIWDTQEWIVL